jgi:methionyl aminopeptidase
MNFGSKWLVETPTIKGKNSVVAIETFITTTSTYAESLHNGWTMVGNKGGYMAQYEHTIIVTDGVPIILTEKNEL